MMIEVVRAEVMETRTHPALRFLCHQAKNLYNRALYVYKQAKGKGKFFNYYELDKILKHEQCYKLLPAHTAQHTLKLVVRNWRAFYKARKEFTKNATKFLGPPKPPKYKKPKGEMVAIITNQQTRIREGYLLLPKKVGWKIRTRLTSIDKVREVRIVPRGVGYTVNNCVFKSYSILPEVL